MARTTATARGMKDQASSERSTSGRRARSSAGSGSAHAPRRVESHQWARRGGAPGAEGVLRQVGGHPQVRDDGRVSGLHGHSARSRDSVSHGCVQEAHHRGSRARRRGSWAARGRRRPLPCAPCLAGWRRGRAPPGICRQTEGARASQSRRSIRGRPSRRRRRSRPRGASRQRPQRRCRPRPTRRQSRTRRVSCRRHQRTA